MTPGVSCCMQQPVERWNSSERMPIDLPSS